MTNERINPLKLAIGLLIDYFRWSQLTPMITVWGFGLLMLTALQAWGVLALVSAWCLTVAHALGRLGRAVEHSGLGEPRRQDGLI